MKHYKSEECLYNQNPNYSSLRRWRSPEMFLSNTSISSGYSTDSLLPSFEDQDEKIDDFQYNRYEAIQMRAEEIMRRDKQMDERMMTRLRSKRQCKENLQESK